MKILLKSSLVGIFLTTMPGAASAQKEASSKTPAPFTEGQLTLVITSGSRTETHLYQRKGDQLRIAQPGDLIPTPPLNLVNLRSGRVTILFPQNGTARTIETTDEKPPAPSDSSTPGFPSMPGLPPGIGPGAAVVPATTEPGQVPAGIGPDLSQPTVPTDGTTPALPETPLPGGVPANPAMPMMPEMPPIPGGPDAVEAFVLKAGEETKTLHGYPCTRHTLDLPHEGRLTLWLTPDKPLFPFHRLRTEGPESLRNADWPDQLAALLRSKGLFPLLITQHDREHSPAPEEKPARPGPERARWEVTSIQNTALKDPEESLFSTPETFHQLRD